MHGEGGQAVFKSSKRYVQRVGRDVPKPALTDAAGRKHPRTASSTGLQFSKPFHSQRRQRNHDSFACLAALRWQMPMGGAQVDLMPSVADLLTLAHTEQQQQSYGKLIVAA